MLESEQLDAGRLSSNKDAENVAVIICSICFAFRNRICTLSLSKSCQPYFGGILRKILVLFGQKGRKSAINTPRLLRGTGKPSSPASVGAISDCSIVE